MIAGLDSSTSVPTSAQLADAKARGVKLWSGYLATRSGVGLLHPWSQEEFARVRKAGLAALGFCSGRDDPVACKRRAAEWGVRLCLDVEQGIRSDGPWVQPWLNDSGAGLYGNAPVFSGRKAAFYVFAAYPGIDPQRTWPQTPARPNGPCAWQWQGTHTEFGCLVDRGWYDDWFAIGSPGETQWTSLGGAWTRVPVVAQNKDGRLELFVVGDDGHLHVLAQGAPNGGWWERWVDLGAGPPGGLPGDPVLARNLDGRLEVFVRGGDGRVQHRWQKTAGGALTRNWASLGGALARGPAVARNRDGRLELFGLAGDGDVWRLAQNEANGSWWAEWERVGEGPAGGVNGDLIVASNQDGRLELFARSGDGSVHRRRQTSPGSAFEPRVGVVGWRVAARSGRRAEQGRSVGAVRRGRRRASARAGAERAERALVGAVGRSRRGSAGWDAR